jgi:hypothetical protein
MSLARSRLLEIRNKTYELLQNCIPATVVMKVCVCVCVCVCVHMYVCMYACVCTCVYVCQSRGLTGVLVFVRWFAWVPDIITILMQVGSRRHAATIVHRSMCHFCTCHPFHTPWQCRHQAMGLTLHLCMRM